MMRRGSLHRGGVLAGRRVIGLTCAVLALAAGFFAQRSLRRSAQAQIADASSRAAQGAAEHAASTLTFASQGLQARAASAAAVSSLRQVLAVREHGRHDVADQLTTETAFEPYRKDFPVLGVLTGKDDQFVRGMDLAELERTGVADAARRNGAASALMIAQGKAWLVAAGQIVVSGGANPVPVLVLAQPLDSAALRSIAWPKEAGTAVLVAASGHVLGEAGPSDAVAALERLEAQAAPAQREAHEPGWRWSAAAREVSPGLWLWTAVDTSPVVRDALAPLGTTTSIVWGAAALAAFAALLLGFRRPAPAPAPLALDQTQVSMRLQAVSGTNMTVISGGSAAPATMAENPNGQQFGRYQLVHQLGSGGMGDVYLAVAFGAEGFRRNFVVKRLRPELSRDPRLVTQFVDEARLASGLVHSNIVPVFDFGRMGEEYYMAQEYISGRDLERLTARSLECDGKPLPAHLLFYAAHEVLQALSYAHAKADDAGKALDLVHRDVSPQNVMVSARGEVKLLDFGIVKSSARANQTEAGVVKGNVVYMAPEQARGAEVDRRADLFSLGLVLYRCLAGHALYQETNAYQLLVHAANGPSEAELEAVKALPSPAPELLERALQVDPARRFQTAQEFAAALPPPRPGDAAELAALVERLFGPELAVERSALTQATAAAQPQVNGGAA